MNHRELKFVSKWHEDTGDKWRDRNRKEMNKVIDAYNAWLIDGVPPQERDRLLRLIEFGKQTIGPYDDSYLKELVEMEEFVMNSQ